MPCYAQPRLEGPAGVLYMKGASKGDTYVLNTKPASFATAQKLLPEPAGWPPGCL
jgi:hypothetical protein